MSLFLFTSSAWLPEYFFTHLKSVLFTWCEAKQQSTACRLCNTTGYNLKNVVGAMYHLLLFKENFWIQSSSLDLPAHNHEPLEENSSESLVVNLSHTASVGHSAFLWVLWDLSWRASGCGAISCLGSWSINAGWSRFADISKIFYQIKCYSWVKQTGFQAYKIFFKLERHKFVHIF